MGKNPQQQKQSLSSDTTLLNRYEELTALSDWLADVCQHVEIYLDEVAQVTPEQATSFKGAIDAAVDQLQRLRKQFADQNHEPHDGETLNSSEK